VNTLEKNTSSTRITYVRGTFRPPLGVRLRVRLENQLTQVIQGMTMMQQSITVMHHDITSMKQTIADMQHDIVGVQHDITVMQQDITGIQQTMATKQDLADLEQALRNRIDSVDGTLSTAIRDGFTRLHDEINDLNIDLALDEQKTEELEAKTESNARKIRRLNQRVFRLEGGSDRI
jgi:chromosome segregation ATPase